MSALEGNRPPRVCVVIPNWNGIEHLPTCLEALADQTLSDFETVVVDNGSSDASVAYVKDRWPQTLLIELGSNRGFPAACNAGILASDAEYVVLLNNDTRAEPDWLANLVAAMDAAPGFSWGTSKLVRFDDPGVIDSAGHVYSVWVGAAHNIGDGEPAASYVERAHVFGATAAAAIYRRSLFEDIGLFDDEFFFIHEDTDLDVRANVAGHRCLFVADAVVRHRRGASYEVSRELHLLGVRNRIWATRAFPAGVVVVWMATKVLRAFRWFPARLLGRRTSKRAAPSAWRDVPPGAVVRTTFEAMLTLRRKRREVASTRRLDSIQVLRLLRETTPARRALARSNQ